MMDPPRRRVEGTRLTSVDMPAIVLEASPEMRFVGTQEFDLYGIAHAEQFIFCEENGSGTVTRWLLIQFEHFLAGTSQTYNYRLKDRISLGDFDYMHDSHVLVREPDQSSESPSDGEHMIRLVTAAGYELPSEAISHRFIRILDETRRNEFLIIYGEDLAPMEIVAADIADDLPASTRRVKIEADTLARALASFQVVEG